MDMDMSRAIEVRTGRQREQQQAVARPCRVRFSVVVTGSGTASLVGGNGLAFNVWMLEEPSFTYGLIADEPLTDGQLPLATATVLSWRTLDETENNARGQVWLGAEVGFHVQSSKADAKLRFSLTFEGYGMRSVIETN